MDDSRVLRYSTREIAIVGLFAAITAVFSQISIPLGSVPFSMGLFAVLLCSVALNTKLAATSQIIYLLLGAFGLPVFSGFQGGLQRLSGPTGGFLISYPIIALVIPLLLSALRSHSAKAMFAACISGVVICHTCGVLWLSVSAHLSLSQAFLTASLPFIAGDVIKSGLVCVVGVRIRQILTSIQN